MRKALHPHRAAEAVADDWELRASPARSRCVSSYCASYCACCGQNHSMLLRFQGSLAGQSAVVMSIYC